MKKLVILALLVLTAVVIACAKEELPPSPPAPGAVGGGAFAGRAVFTGGQGEYAEDTADFFSISSDTPAYGEVLTATCEGDQFVYGSGYDTDVNGQWREFGYDCEQVGNSNWCRGSAGVDREVTAENYAAGDNYILCYGCTKEAGQWNCHWAFAGGGGRWMAHQFNVHEPAATQVCGNGIVEEPEQCDDNNLIDGDGCSAGCIVEAPTAGCTSDAQCPEGQTCDTETGVCGMPAEGCTSDTDCATGSVCNMEFHQCVEVAGSCTTDADCQTEGSNFFCNGEGQCEELPTTPEGPTGLEQPCTDSDGGINPLTQGSVQLSNGSIYTDSCVGWTTVGELACSINYTNINYTNGTKVNPIDVIDSGCLNRAGCIGGSCTTCLNGACVRELCSKNDGGDILKAGTLLLSNGSLWSDSCLTSKKNFLEELVCSTGSNFTRTLVNCTGAAGCAGGICTNCSASRCVRIS